MNFFLVTLCGIYATLVLSASNSSCLSNMTSYHLGLCKNQATDLTNQASVLVNQATVLVNQATVITKSIDCPNKSSNCPNKTKQLS